MTRGRNIVKVSVLTPVFNEEAQLTGILDRFLAQEDPGGEIEFLFVDGRSEDQTRARLLETAASDPRVRVLDNPRRTTSAGLCVALPQARGEYVARMDAHALYPLDYLRRGIERLERGDVVGVSGPQIAVGHDRWSRRVAAALGTPLGVGGSNFRRPITAETETDSGFTGLWRRDLLLRHGGWDELAYPNEDSELAARLRKAGGRLVLVPELAAQYTPRNSLRALSVQYWRYGRSRARTARLHPMTVRRSHLLPPLLVLAGGLALMAPAGIARAARLSLAGYGGVLLATAIRADSVPSEAPFIPLVLIVMHVSWGAGYLLGCAYPAPAVRPLTES
jgi:succinoglycan biosynthesis protein ExoA